MARRMRTDLDCPRCGRVCRVLAYGLVDWLCCDRCKQRWVRGVWTHGADYTPDELHTVEQELLNYRPHRLAAAALA
jgi:ribosomal protein L37AE/L43A